MILCSLFKYDDNRCSKKLMFKPPNITFMVSPIITRVITANNEEEIYKNKSFLLTVSF